jgi:hypothetical protein
MMLCQINEPSGSFSARGAHPEARRAEGSHEILPRFARQDEGSNREENTPTPHLVNDPPYQDLDLVVCRNVLIYFSLPLQMRVLRNFYEGLNRGGFLLLGKSEVPMGEGIALFECVDEKAKLFKKAEIHKFKEAKKAREEKKEDSKTRWIIYHGKPYKEI